MDPEHPRDGGGGGGGGDETGLQNPLAPPRLCANNCGFFGSPATNNLCSKCYRKAYIVQVDNSNNTSHGKQPASVAVAAPAEAFNPVIIHQAVGGDAAGTSAKELSTGISPSSSSSPPLAAATTTGAKPKPMPNRCGCCRKKVGLMGFWCRCGGVFCPVHRYSDKHACAFDYKAAAKDAIARANPVLKPDKLDKI